MDEAVFHFKVGVIECIVFEDGGGPRVATQFLPEAPPDELERIVREHGLDPQAVPFSINIFLIKTGDYKVLFDTGLGPSASNLPDRLRGEGVDPDTVDLIVITHGHWDHIGGITNAEGDFLYPKARYAISKAEWDYWTAPERFAESDDNPAKVVWSALSAHPERVTLLDMSTGEAEIVPGLCAIAAPGHTIGHLAVMMESDGQKALHIADAAHQYFQLDCPQWSPSFDQDKTDSVNTRRALFQRAAMEHALLCAYHFPFPGVGYVNEQSGKLAWQPQ